MQAFHNDPAIKERYRARVRAHAATDRLLQSYAYWATSGTGVHRGCAIGCTLEGNDHAAYEDELGIPREIAYLEDAIFEALPRGDLARDIFLVPSSYHPGEYAGAFPERLLQAIPVGADLRHVAGQLRAAVAAHPHFASGSADVEPPSDPCFADCSFPEADGAACAGCHRDAADAVLWDWTIAQADAGDPGLAAERLAEMLLTLLAQAPCPG